MIGTQEEADVIALWDIRGDSAPVGWRYVNQGTYRKVYLSPSGTIYKREIIPRGQSSAGNVSEFRNFSNIVHIPVQGWRIPRFAIFYSNDKPIIAMEYVTGKSVEWTYCDPYGDGYCECSKPYGVCSNTIGEEAHENWGLTDVTFENFLIEDDGIKVLIDAGN